MDLGTTGGDDSVRAASNEVGDGREAVTGGGDPGYGGGDDDGGDDDGGKERGDNVWRWRAAAMLATTVATATMAEMASDGEGNGGAADPLTLVER